MNKGSLVIHISHIGFAQPALWDNSIKMQLRRGSDLRLCVCAHGYSLSETANPKCLWKPEGGQERPQTTLRSSLTDAEPHRNC